MTERNETLVVTVDLKEWDLQRANFWFRLGKWSKRILLVLMPLIGLLLLARVEVSKMFKNPPVAAVLTVLIVFPILYPVILWFQTKRGFANLQNLQTRILYAFSADGYKVSDAKSSADIDWATILRAAESKHSSLLSSIVISYDSETVFRRARQHPSAEEPSQTIARKQGKCSLGAPCPTTQLAADGAIACFSSNLVLQLEC